MFEESSVSLYPVFRSRGVLDACGEIAVSLPARIIHRILDHAAIGSLPPQPGVLDDIFRLGGASEYPARNPKEPRTHLEKCRTRAVVSCGIHPSILPWSRQSVTGFQQFGRSLLP